MWRAMYIIINHCSLNEISLFSSYFVFFQLLCLIGEAVEEFSEDVNGAVVNIRNKGDKLSLWTRDSRRQDATLKIGFVF
jgi:hypothetical protein